MNLTPILPSPDKTQQPGIQAQLPADQGGDAIQSASKPTVLASDFETFLKMLTTQAKYQDPLEPLDSSEYAAQLAQFSMVEQQVVTNDLMEKLLGARAPGDMANFASWIGKEALTISPAKFDGTPVSILPEPAVGADQIVLVVTNAQGTPVQQTVMPVTDQPIKWDGRKDDGTVFPPGEYSFEIESRSNGDILSTDKARTYSRVSEARLENGETLLLLGSGYLVRSSDVLGLREPLQSGATP